MKLMKLMACAALAVACAVGFTGCSKKVDASKPRVADGAVLALVVQAPTKTSLAPLVEKYKLNDVKAALEKAPADAKEFFEKIELDKIESKWLLVTVGGEIAKDKVPDVAFVAATTLDLDKFVAEFEKSAKGEKKPEFKKTTIAGVSAYEITSKKDKVVPCVAALDGQLIIVASSAAFLEKQIALYRDGKGESADFSSFGLPGNGILRIKAVKVGDVVKKALGEDAAMLEMVNGIIPEGDKIVLGLNSVEIALSASDDGKNAKLDLTVETASDADAEKLITAAKGGLTMATAAAKETVKDESDKAAALGALESATAVNEGKVAKISAAAPAEPIFKLVSEMIK